MKQNIAFIGGGNMATSLVTGLIAQGLSASNILVSEPDPAKREQLVDRCGISTTSNNADTLVNDIVILAVKPQVMASVCSDIASNENVTHPIYISIAAGIRTTDLNRWLGGECKIVRCMPNTPALLQCGAAGLYAADNVSADQKQSCEDILKAVGEVVWVANESLLDAVTALSGSGPAYFFLLMEAMQQAGESLGLSPDQSRLLTSQTALGAARMAIESSDAPATLRINVTSKGGTTEKAIDTFEQGGFHQLVSKAINTAFERSQSLADELGKKQ